MQCIICRKEFDKRTSLCNHTNRIHNISKQDYYNKYIKKEYEGICKYNDCKNATKFLNIEDGYKDCCCLEHTNLYRYGVKSNLNLDSTKKNAQKNSHTQKAIDKQKATNLEKYGSVAPIGNEEVRNKIKQTCIDKYGVDNPWKSEEIKQICADSKLEKYGNSNYNNREKAKQTCLERYGVEHQMKSSIIKEKQKNTCIERYNTDYYICSKEFKNKSTATCLEKYGTEYIFQSDYFKNMSKISCINRFGVDIISKSENIIRKRIQTRLNAVNQFEQDNDCISISKVIGLYGQGWLAIKDELNLIHLSNNSFILNSEIDKIVQYTNTHTRSRIEDTIFEYIQSIYSGTIIRNTRSIIKPKELDIYLPDKNLAIEVDGIWYHSTNRGTPIDYHLKKTEACEKLGINLIHITDWEWNNQKEICKSIIADNIGVYDIDIDANSCDIRTVAKKESDDFLEVNHLNGKVDSTYRIGLYYKNELVKLICIGNSIYHIDKMEIFRICTRLNTNVMNGFSKLLQYQPFDLIYYMDRSKFNSSKYNTIGFSIINSIKPSCVYYKGKDLKSYVENIVVNDYLQIYDCGKIVLSYNKKNNSLKYT